MLIENFKRPGSKEKNTLSSFSLSNLAIATSNLCAKSFITDASVSTVEHRAILVMCIAVAGFLGFTQCNFTGPLKGKGPPRFPLPLVEFECAEWDILARNYIMSDGSDLLGKFSNLQYIVFAKMLLMRMKDLSVDIRIRSRRSFFDLFPELNKKRSQRRGQSDTPEPSQSCTSPPPQHMSFSPGKKGIWPKLSLEHSNLFLIVVKVANESSGKQQRVVGESSDQIRLSDEVGLTELEKMLTHQTFTSYALCMWHN
ncbi:nuclear pore complex protein NUP1 [Trifolium repens]|nr:nuclear pore complex protein NUP1 [Trifolium repens]